MSADCENCTAPCCSDLCVEDQALQFYYPLNLARAYFRKHGADLQLVRTVPIPGSEERASRFRCTAKDERPGVPFRCTIWKGRPEVCEQFDCSADAIGASCVWPREQQREGVGET